MKNFWSAEGATALRRVACSTPLLAFDFDGTLAPIVARPDDARVPTPLAQRLSQLAQRCPVAIITGRSVADVKGRLGFTPRHIVGNHGAERDGEVAAPGSATLDPLRALLAQQTQALKQAQIQIEDKGFSVALHYRLAQDRERAVALIEEVLRPLGPAMRRFGGKCVENVVPAASPDKGDAVMALMAATGTKSVLFAGDDINDEAVFERATRDWLTVRIGNDDLRSKAQFFLTGQSELTQLLHELLQALDAA